MRRKKLAGRLLAGILTAALSMSLCLSALAEEEVLVEEPTTEAAAETAAETDSDAALEDIIPDVEIDITQTEGTAGDEIPAEAQAETIVIEGAEEIAGTQAEEAEEAVPQLERVTVHDPSIVKSEDGTYYVLGSHIASAKSSDLMKWTQLNFDYGTPENAPFYGNLQENFARPFEWAGYNDGDCVGGYAIWAPDAIWNPYYEWEDGSTGAYMLYCCASSTWRRSCICYLVSKTFEGPYTYVDTLIYSGFTKTGEPDGNSARDTKWDNDYLNLTALIEKGSANGGIDEISDSWFTKDGGWNNNYAPNAIDPNLFFDKDGEKLYMSYGSWSGGLFLLELDRTTGQAIYPGVDSVDEVSGNFVDRYFGVHLTGGNHESGEAPYIRYDAQTGYYYLYETYGGLLAEGGYNMRLFRSENPTGPYLDAKGQNAADNGQSNDLYGIKLIGNYQFFDQTGMRAAGHNSALIDEDGSRYLFYHQRFEAKPQMEAHQVRVHQQFLNEDLWPTTAVYEYRGETPSHYEDAEVTGSYELINHGTKTNGDMIYAQMLTLHEDGTVDGAFTGTWTKTDSGSGYDYVTMEMSNGTTYKGYFFRQHKETATVGDPVMTFSAIGNDNTCIWGSMVDMDNPAMVANMAAVSLDQIVPKATTTDLELPTSVMGADVVWTSMDEAVITSDGKITQQEDDESAILTADVTLGDTTIRQKYRVTVRSAAKMIVGYDFEAVAEDGTVPAIDGSLLSEAAVPNGSAAVIADETRGNVLQVTNEPGAQGVSYLALPETTLQDISSSGYTVAMWVKIGADTFEHSALFEADAAAAYPMTRIGANLIARINADAYSDVQGALLTTNGERDVWQHVVYTADPYGMKVYLNGELVGEEEKDLAACFKKKKTGISQTKNVMVGSGFIWGDEDCRDARFDDVKIFKGILTAEEVQTLYSGQ